MQKQLLNMMTKISKPIVQWEKHLLHQLNIQKINQKQNQLSKNQKNHQLYAPAREKLNLKTDSFSKSTEQRRNSGKSTQINKPNVKKHSAAIQSISQKQTIHSTNKIRIIFKIKSKTYSMHTLIQIKEKYPKLWYVHLRKQHIDSIQQKKIMINPICNQYGNSYSKSAYLEHLAKNNKIDPISKKTLQTPIMYNNLNLKKAIEAYLQKNPWAYDQQQL